MNITVYLDESGQESQNHVVVSGFFGNEVQWNMFSEKWNQGLRRKQYLHMKELRFRERRTDCSWSDWRRSLNNAVFGASTDVLRQATTLT